MTLEIQKIDDRRDFSSHFLIREIEGENAPPLCGDMNLLINLLDRI